MNSKINLQRPVPTLTASPAAVSPMGAMWRTIRGYILWSYERGSLHYDIMVTLILLFLFVSPRFINFKDKPVATLPLQHSEVLVKEQQNSGSEARFIYEVRVDDLHGASTDTEIQAAILNIIEPISGD